jgi:hypothetical protein
MPAADITVYYVANDIEDETFRDVIRKLFKETYCGSLNFPPSIN